METMSNLLEQKRRSHSESTEVSFKRGWIDTTRGALLTSPAAMQAVQEKKTELLKKNLTSSAKAAQAALREQRAASSAQPKTVSARAEMACEKI